MFSKTLFKQHKAVIYVKMETEEDTYSTIFNALKHPIRRRILRIVDDKPSTYTEIQTHLNIDNGLLNYHLDNMRSLLTKDKNSNYSLSEFGRGATMLLEKVEHPVTKQENTFLGLTPLQLKSIMALLIIGIGVLTFLYTGLDNRYNVLETRYEVMETRYEALKSTQAEEQKRLESNIVYETLKISLIEKQIPDFNLLTRNTSNVVLSTELIEGVDVPIWIGGYKIILMSPDEIEAKAEAEGTF